MDIKNILNLQNRKVALIELTKLVHVSSEIVRACIFNQWDYSKNWAFPNPFRIACKVNEYGTPEERLDSLLIFQTLENVKNCSERETILLLAILYNSCPLINLDPDVKFAAISKIVPQEISIQISEFQKRAYEDKNMDAFMLKKIQNDSGEIELKIDI